MTTPLPGGKDLPTDHPLFGCWLKISRAREHVNALQMDMKAWQRNPVDVRTVGEFDPQNNLWAERIQVILNLPPEWGTLVGDAVHNFRSALDLIAFELAFIDQGGRERTGTGFPLVTSNDWTNPGVQAAIRYLSGPHQAMVEASQPPAPTGDQWHPLISLAKLANDDPSRTSAYRCWPMNGEITPL